MNVNDHICVLFEELADASVAVESVTRQSDHVWRLECLEGTLFVDALFDDEDGLLTLRVTLPHPQEDQVEAAYEWMLLLNQLASELNGLRYGLDGNAVPMQEMDIATHDLDLPQLRSLCEFFTAKAAFWAIAASSGAFDGDDEELQNTFDQMVSNPDVVRV